VEFKYRILDAIDIIEKLSLAKLYKGVEKRGGRTESLFF
jgi:hypothetical protein